MKSRIQNLSASNKILRVIWRIIWLFLFRPSPRIFHGWRRFLLRLFGARLGKQVYVYPSVQIWAPWNLEMLDHSCLSHFVDCYCVDKIFIGKYATVSQYSFLCTANHDYSISGMPLISAPIRIHDYVWVTADVFVGPGVIIGEGAVVCARSTVTKDVEPWYVISCTPKNFSRPRDRVNFFGN